LISSPATQLLLLYLTSLLLVQVIVDQIVISTPLFVVPKVVFKHVLVLETNAFWVHDRVLSVSRLQLDLLVNCAFSLIY